MLKNIYIILNLDALKEFLIFFIKSFSYFNSLKVRAKSFNINYSLK